MVKTKMEYAPIKFIGFKAYQIVLVILEIHDQKIGKKKNSITVFFVNLGFGAKFIRQISLEQLCHLLKRYWHGCRIRLARLKSLIQ